MDVQHDIAELPFTDVDIKKVMAKTKANQGDAILALMKHQGHVDKAIAELSK